MKKSVLFIPCVLAALAGCNNPASKEGATEKKPDTLTAAPAKAEAPAAPAPPLDSATAMKKWQEYMTPGDMHKMVASFNGKWAGEVTMWMAEGAPPTKNKTEIENKMILGGRYQQSSYKGTMNGMPFEGMSVMGYDNAKKEFESTWVDNLGTGIIKLTGSYDAGTKSIALKGKCMDPMSGKEMEMRQIMKFPDDKHQEVEMFQTPPGGKEFKCMDIMLTKK